MPLRRHLSAVLAFGLIWVASALHAPSALADDPEPEVSDTDPEATPEDTGDVWDSLLQLQITLGLDTPFGVAGGAIEFTPWRYLTIYAGGGVTRAGGRVSGGLRLNMPIGNAAVQLMFGVGGGSQGWDSDVPANREPGVAASENGTVSRHWDFAFDLHTGIAFEYRWDSGLFGRIAFGAQGIVESDADTCVQRAPDSDVETDCTFPPDSLATPIWGWAGLTVGYALDL